MLRLSVLTALLGVIVVGSSGCCGFHRPLLGQRCWFDDCNSCHFSRVGHGGEIYRESSSVHHTGCDDGAGSCGDGCGGCGLASLLGIRPRHGLLGWGCGKAYLGDYLSYPPKCEPCDHYGNYIGHGGMRYADHHEYVDEEYIVTEPVEEYTVREVHGASASAAPKVTTSKRVTQSQATSRKTAGGVRPATKSRVVSRGNPPQPPTFKTSSRP